MHRQRSNGKRHIQAGPGRRDWLLALVLVGTVAFVHQQKPGGFLAEPEDQAGWENFKTAYGLASFGDDGYFVRAVHNGYHLFFTTYRYGWRFTRRQEGDSIRACADCHSPDDLAYAFVGGDRFDPELGRRVSFEERLMRCYADPARMDGFVPTLYDPAIQDLRILARAVAHDLGLSEGQREPGT